MPEGADVPYLSGSAPVACTARSVQDLCSSSWCIPSSTQPSVYVCLCTLSRRHSLVAPRRNSGLWHVCTSGKQHKAQKENGLVSGLQDHRYGCRR